MKFCPYCGSELVGENAVFCMECGKQMPERNQQEPSNTQNDFEEKRNREDSADSTPVLDDRESQEPVVTDPDVGYDGYYDDVIPDDHGNIRSGVDKQLIKKIVVLGVSVVLIICACVAIMYIL